MSDIYSMTNESQAFQMAADAAREKVAEFMHSRSIATGHGDTIEDLLAELGGYIDILRADRDRWKRGLENIE
jgi:hypothetical protein